MTFVTHNQIKKFQFLCDYALTLSAYIIVNFLNICQTNTTLATWFCRA